MRTMNMNKVLLGYLMIIFVFSLSAEPKLKTTILVVGKSTFNVEIADNDLSRAKGLMKRPFLAPNKGMVFVFNRDEILSFWMKDTSIPLSVAYIDVGGRIIDIFDLEPFNTREVRSSSFARYALELNRGAFEKAGVKVGDVIHNLPR